MKSAEKSFKERRAIPSVQGQERCLSALTWSVMSSHATANGVSNVHKITACTEMQLYQCVRERLVAELTCEQPLI